MSDAMKMLGDFNVEDYVGQFEVRGDADYKPNEREQEILIHFAHGLIADLQEKIRNGDMCLTCGGTGLTQAQLVQFEKEHG